MFKFFQRLRDFMPKFKGIRSKKLKSYIVTVEQSKEDLIINIQCLKTGINIKICLDEMDEIYEWIDDQPDGLE
jgi:hypothetical protein